MPIRHSISRIFALAACLTVTFTSARAQDDAPAIFPHSQSSRLYASGQANIIFQSHPPFHSPYQGDNSTVSRGEYKTSLVGTLFLGAQLNKNPRYNTDFILNFESSGGRGISQALGMAGFTNLDVVRNPTLGSTPYLARIQLHQTIGLTSKLVDASRNVFSLATKVPERRIEIRIGKMGLPDTFDQNSIGTDAHLQFMNWTIDNNGAFDYAADTRGYTYAAIIEFDTANWTARYGIATVSAVANGIDFDWDLTRARGENYEIEWRKGPLSPLLNKDRKGAMRILAYINHAHMGNYREAVNAFLSGADKTPDIVAHEHFGATKYGFGFNTEQELTPTVRAFMRLGWNDDRNESYEYTEVAQTFELGADINGKAWSRNNDKIGLAFVSNAIKRDHQNYLLNDGLGFLIGDGHLNYGRENILEGYYNMHAWRGLYYAFDTEYIAHPGYNRDRGPIIVPSVRMHVDF